MANWQPIYKTALLYRAEIIKSCLEEEEIAVIILNKKESAHQIHGYYEIRVEPDQILRAIKIIENDITFG